METKVHNTESSVSEYQAPLPPVQAPDNCFVFELGGAESPEEIVLIISFEHLESLHKCLEVLIEESKKPQPEGNTGFALTYPGRRRETAPVSD